jgi:membrane protease YdiL (CAAX protease family)
MEAPRDAGVDLALLAGVAGWNVLQNSVSRRAYGVLNAAGSAAVLAAGRAAGLDRVDLGLGAGAVGRGVRAGGLISGVVVAAVASTASTTTGRRLFRDERVERHGLGELAGEILFRIPIGTALFEELLFRGLLWGRWAGRRGETAATAVSSVLFGLWHVIPTKRTLAVYRAGAFGRTNARLAVAMTTAVAATAVAGAGFAWLRSRARSVVAPALLHAAINTAGYAAAWWVASAGESTPPGSGLSPRARYSRGD